MECRKLPTPKTPKTIAYKNFSSSLPSGYFYGAAQNVICRCGVVINIDIEYSWKFCWNAGGRTNNRAEVISLWGSLYYARWLNLNVVHIFSDSQITIDWISKQTSFSPPLMQHWMQ